MIGSQKSIANNPGKLAAILGEASANFIKQGKLIKVGKGVYRYDPEVIADVELFDFSSATKEQIFARDGYRCVVCGRGRTDRVEICADHKVPKDKGGTNEAENGQNAMH